MRNPVIFRSVASSSFRASYRARRQQQQLIQVGGSIGAVALLLFISWPGIQQSLKTTSLVRDKASEQSAQLELQKLDEERLLAESDIADQRLQTYCTDFVFSQSDSGRMAAVSEGLRVLDPVTKQPLAEGSIICDVTGRTAIVRGGILTDVKVSRNPNRLQLIQTALQAKGLKIQAGDPEVRPASAQQDNIRP
jgi:hypothetical protein